MKYTDLNINQRISLKGIFMEGKIMNQCGLLMVCFNFKVAVEFFLNEDMDALEIELKKSISRGF